MVKHAPRDHDVETVPSKWQLEQITLYGGKVTHSLLRGHLLCDLKGCNAMIERHVFTYAQPFCNEHASVSGAAADVEETSIPHSLLES